MDVNTLAYKIVQQSIGEKPSDKPRDERRVNGGNARAKKLTAAERSEIAKKAASKRWKKESAS